MLKELLLMGGVRNLATQLASPRSYDLRPFHEFIFSEIKKGGEEVNRSGKDFVNLTSLPQDDFVAALKAGEKRVQERGKKHVAQFVSSFEGGALQKGVVGLFSESPFILHVKRGISEVTNPLRYAFAGPRSQVTIINDFRYLAEKLGNGKSLFDFAQTLPAEQGKRVLETGPRIHLFDSIRRADRAANSGLIQLGERRVPTAVTSVFKLVVKHAATTAFTTGALGIFLYLGLSQFNKLQTPNGASA